MAEAVFDPVGTLGPQIFGLPVDREILFSNYKGNYKKRIEKRQRKLIVKLSFIKPFLQKREQVLLVTTGYSPLNRLAQYLTGFLFVFFKRSLFVFSLFGRKCYHRFDQSLYGNQGVKNREFTPPPCGKSKQQNHHECTTGIKQDIIKIWVATRYEGLVILIGKGVEYGQRQSSK